MATSMKKEVYVIPTSYGQQRLWFLDQLLPHNTAFIIAVSLRFKGSLDTHALCRSINYLIDRHESLRTSFASQDGLPVQVISHELTIDVPVIDLSLLDYEERIEQEARTASQISSFPFDLTSAPLIRASLLKLSDDEHKLLMAIHHIICDGWSMDVFYREMAACYEAFSSGREPKLEDLSIGYADFALWQRDMFDGNDEENELLDQVEFWAERLGGDLPILNLPTDRIRPVMQSYRGARHYLDIPAEMTAQLRAFSLEHHATLFMTLLAGFYGLLHRLSGQNDITVGTSIAGRTSPEIEPLIGLFLNTLVLRAGIGEKANFKEIIEEVKHVSVSAYANQEVPIEKIIEVLQPERHLSHNPLFQVMFIYQNAATPPRKLGDVNVKLEEIDNQTAKFDLTLELMDGAKGELNGWIEYNTDLFDQESIARIGRQYMRVLDWIIEKPARPISEVELLSEEEREEVVYGWNHTKADYETGVCIHEMIEREAERNGQQTAIESETEKLSYGEMNERANQLAHYLMEMGIGAEDRVGIHMERSIDMVVSLIAVLKSGAAYVPIDTTHPSERISYLLDDSGAKAVISKGSLAGKLAEQRVRVVCLEQEREEIKKHSKENPTGRADEQNLAYVIYTSGTTGKPKAVCLEHRSLVNYAQSAAKNFELTRADRVLQFASISFDTSAEEIYPILMKGGSLILRSESMTSSVKTFLDECEKRAITVMDLPTAYWHEIAARIGGEGEKLGKSVRLVIIGGEKAQAPRVNKWQKEVGENVRLVNTYGPTETTIVATLAELTTEKLEGREAPIGKPVSNVKCYVLGRDLKVVGAGVSGELYISGAGLARCYKGREELTAERFLPNPYGETGERMYRTGDLCRYNNKGELEYIGRSDSQVKVRGFRVEPAEVEAALMNVEGITEAVVIGRAESGGNRLVAYVVADELRKPGIKEIREQLKRVLPDHQIPSAYVYMEKLPRGRTGKVDQKALPEPGTERPELEEGYVEARSDNEREVAEIFKQILGVNRIGIDDNFFELGGHSLLATQVIARVREHFGVEVTLRELFEQPTVAGLVKHITGEEREPGIEEELPPIKKAPRDQPLPLSFPQERLWFISQLDPGNVSYNVPRVLRLKGRLSVEVMEQTITELKRRHEILRTTFPTVDGRPVQVIGAPEKYRLSVIDLSEFEESEREHELKNIIDGESRRKFDLDNGPLLRLFLVRMAEKEHVLVLVEHHLIHDGWTQGVLVRDVMAIYEAYVKGQQSPLKDLEIQYGDFAYWQREWMTGSVMDKQLEYWKKQLSGAKGLLELPTDRARPAVISGHGAEQILEIREELAEKLRKLSREEGVTLFMVMIAGFKVLMNRYSGQEDMVIGSGIANRRRKEMEGLLGMIINTQVLRTDMSGDPQCVELFKRVREVTLGAYENQDLPFDRIVEELHPVRSLSYNPLAQVFYTFFDVPMNEMRLPGIEIEEIVTHNRSAKFDINVVVLLPQEQRVGSGNHAAGGNEIRVIFEYSTDLFDDETMSRMMEHYERLLESMVKDKHQRISQLDMLTDRERDQLLFGWNDTTVDYAKDKFIHSMFEDQAKLTPEAVALICGDERISYAELNTRANQLASYLREIGIGRGSIVGICLERSVNMIVGLIGILKAGAAYLPLDPEYPMERIAFMFTDAKASALLTEEKFAERIFDHDAKVIYLDSDWPAIAECDERNLPNEVLPEDLAYVIYTSGSTGNPKGCQLEHRNFSNYLRWAINYYFEHEHAGNFALYSPVSFDFTITNIFCPLLRGKSLFIYDQSQEIHQILEHAFGPQTVIDTMKLTPSHIRLLEDIDVHNTNIRKVIAGGEELRLSHIQTLKRINPAMHIYNEYGPTEATVGCIVKQVESNDNQVTIGRPIYNTRLYILDSNLEPSPIGVPGELYISGAGLARGYINRPEITAERFIPDPFGNELGGRLYRSGDLCRYLPDGDIVFIDRIDSQVKVRGFRIELGEIESMMMNHPQVKEAAVVAQEGEKGEKRLVAYAVTETGEVIDSGEMRKYLKQMLPDYMIPSAYVFKEEMPLNSNGKIDRRALMEEEQKGLEAKATYQEPRTYIEETLAGMWKEVLGIERVGIKDNFFEVGGHSLMAAQIMARVKRNFGVEIPLRLMFDEPTIERLAISIVETQTEQLEDEEMAKILADLEEISDAEV